MTDDSTSLACLVHLDTKHFGAEAVSEALYSTTGSQSEQGAGKLHAITSKCYSQCSCFHSYTCHSNFFPFLQKGLEPYMIWADSCWKWNYFQKTYSVQDGGEIGIPWKQASNFVFYLVCKCALFARLPREVTAKLGTAYFWLPYPTTERGGWGGPALSLAFFSILLAGVIWLSSAA